MNEQRKTVTVVFADLVESTSTAERLDPEVWASVLGRYFELLRGVVEKHGGMVEKFIGDAVVALFGVPTLHEDDALRAVRAALEMPAAARSVGLEVRVGINTGEVIASAQNAMGHAISMAARLEQSASAGAVLIGKDTHALVAGSVEATAIDSLTVKGSTEPLLAWSVTGLTAAPRALRSGTGYVGRERELRALASAFQRAVDDRECVVVTVTAPPGLGKSRLVAEATRSMAFSARVIGGGCLPYGESITYAPVIEAVRQLEAEEGNDVVDRLAAGQSDAQQVIATIRALESGAAQGSPDEAAWAFRRLFEILADDRPLVIAIDDVHWADPLVLDLIEYVATFSVGRSILLLCAARPDLYDVRPDWATVGESSVHVRLAPLTRSDTEILLDALDMSGLHGDARDRIVEASGGVPLFAEQMAALDAEADGTAQVPPTIRALLAARVDRLTPEERQILELGAIEGQVFHRDTIAALIGPEARTRLGSRLMPLVRREFIQPQPGLDGRDAFSFNHALIRDAVYEQMPRRVRADLHERYASLLESQPGASREVIGHHLEQAFREHAALDPADGTALRLARRAGVALADAGRDATARKETGRAIDLLTRADELLSLDPAVRVTVMPDLIDAFVAASDLDRADATHHLAISLARELEDEHSELRAEIAWGTTWPMRDAVGWQEDAFPVLDRAIHYFARIGDESGLAQALLLKGVGLAPYDQVQAIETMKRAAIHAERADDVRMQVEVWDELGGAMLFGPTPYSELIVFVRAEVAWATQRGIPFSIADGQLGEVYALAATNEAEAALARLDELKQFFSQLPGRVSQYGECYTIAGRIERDRGEPAKGLDNYRRAMELFDHSAHRRWWRNAAAGAAHALLDLGRIDEARHVVDGIAERDETHDGSPGAFRLEAEARYMAAIGDLEAATKFARRAVAAVADTGALFAEAHARETLAAILAAAGDPSATAEFEHAREIYSRKGYLPGIDRIAAAIGARAAP